ncbi:50S ribosomal protein L31, partial [Acinetobacter guillouiae]
MRKDIHPAYQQVLFHDTNADVYFLIGSTLQSKQTKEYQGKVYPYVTLDISSASHP